MAPHINFAFQVCGQEVQGQRYTPAVLFHAWVPLLWCTHEGDSIFQVLNPSHQCWLSICSIGNIWGVFPPMRCLPLLSIPIVYLSHLCFIVLHRDKVILLWWTLWLQMKSRFLLGNRRGRFGPVPNSIFVQLFNIINCWGGRKPVFLIKPFVSCLLCTTAFVGKHKRLFSCKKQNKTKTCYWLV